MAWRLRQRRGTASAWSVANPVLGLGEFGYETDTEKIKVGDGITAWNLLDYLTVSPSSHAHPESDVTDLITDLAGKAAVSHGHAESEVTNLVSDLAAKAIPADITTAVSNHEAAGDPHTGYQKENEKDAANGYLGLDSGGMIPDAKIPSGITRDSEAAAAYAPIAKGVTNGDAHDHSGGDGAQIAYSTLSGLPTLGSIADNAEADFAVASKGVTNGDSHDHNGGDGAQIDHVNLANKGTNTHAQVDTHLAASAPHSGHEATANKGAASGYAGLGSNSLVPTAQLGTGSPSGTTYLRGDQTWATPAGGGGSPGGNSGEVQYNDGAGGFAGAANVEIESGNLRLVGTSTPAAPSAGNLVVYSRNRSGRMFPEWIGPSGAETSFQPALFGNNVTMWLPGTGTTAAINFGVNWSISTTQAHPAITNANLVSQMKRATYSTATTAPAVSGVRSGAVVCWRGNAVGLGGFFYFARFAIVTLPASTQFWIGLSGIATALGGEPSAQNDTICFGKDSTDTNWQIICRDGTTATKTDLGIAAAAATDTAWDVMFFCKPNDNKITVRVVQWTATTQNVVANNTELSTNIPRNTIMLAIQSAIRITTGTTAGVYALNRIYVESDT